MHSSTGHSGGNAEEQNANRRTDRQEVLGGRRAGRGGDWPGGHFCYSFTKPLGTFPFLQIQVKLNSNEKFKFKGIIYVVEEVLFQCSMGFVLVAFI